jgi:hypothetical protein
MRDAEYMFHRHDIATSAEAPMEHPEPGHFSGLGDPSVPMQACCCPGRPMFKVVMPPTATRPRPVDLWLCGHHYRASRKALESAKAQVYPLAAATEGALSTGTPAGVPG